MRLTTNKVSIEELLENSVISFYLDFPEIHSIEELIIDYKKESSLKVKKVILDLLTIKGFNIENLIFL